MSRIWGRDRGEKERERESLADATSTNEFVEILKGKMKGDGKLIGKLATLLEMENKSFQVRRDDWMYIYIYIYIYI